jgi:putative colanic acid biosynthesis UDP-glucose lipid carrier transferase
MELQSSSLRLDAESPLRRLLGLQPQHLGYLSLMFDACLFVAAGIGTSVWLRLGHVRHGFDPASVLPPTPTFEADMFNLAQLLSGALLLLVFLGACRTARLHEPLNLLRETGWRSATRATLCYALPPLATLLVALPALRGHDPVVEAFILWLACFTGASAILAIVSRQLYRLLLPALRAGVLAPRRIAVVGSGEAAARVIRQMATRAPELFQLVGVFDDRGADRRSESSVASLVRGDTGALAGLYKNAPFDTIVIALPHSAEERIVRLLQRLRQLPVDIVMAPDLAGFRSPDQSQSDVAGLKLLNMSRRPIREPQRILKGAIDRALAGLALLVLSPLLILVSLLIRLDSPGPILFRQPRQGLGDTLFDVYKFRTMYHDRGDSRGQQQTQRDDPRVTRIGALLRRSSIDELPQLLNVLRGEMSLVGPRPHTPHMLVGDKKIFDIIDEYSFRHRVKPGITGLAQINGYRGAVDTPEHLRTRIDYDLYYIDHWSLWLDLKIIFRTAFICFSGANAY